MLEVFENDLEKKKYEALKFGDIISAYLDNEENSENKQYFVVIGENDDRLLCIPYYNIKIDNNNLRLNKFIEDSDIGIVRDSFIPISCDEYPKKEYELDEREMDLLLKNFKSLGFPLNDPKIPFKNIYKSMDVIEKNNQYYLVLKIEDNVYKLIRLRNNDLVNISPDFSAEISDRSVVDYTYVTTLDMKTFAKIINDKDISFDFMLGYCTDKRTLNKDNICGCIVYYNKTNRFYYIYEINDTLVNGIEISIDDDNEYYVSDKDYSFIPFFGNKVTFDYKRDDYLVLDRFPSDVMEKLNNSNQLPVVSNSIKFSNNNKNFSSSNKDNKPSKVSTIIDKKTLNNDNIVGLIVLFNNKLYYIYAVEGSIVRAIELFKHSAKRRLYVSEKNYSYVPNFNNEITFDYKKDEYDVLDRFSFDIMRKLRSERRQNSVQKKLPSTKKSSNVKSSILSTKVIRDIEQKSDILSISERYPNRTVVKVKGFSSKFFVIGTYDNKIVCISLDDFVRDGKVSYYEFDLSEFRLFLTYDLSNEERLILREERLFLKSLCGKKENNLKLVKKQ